MTACPINACDLRVAMTCERIMLMELGHIVTPACLRPTGAYMVNTYTTYSNQSENRHVFVVIHVSEGHQSQCGTLEVTGLIVGPGLECIRTSSACAPNN